MRVWPPFGISGACALTAVPLSAIPSFCAILVGGRVLAWLSQYSG